MPKIKRTAESAHFKLLASDSDTHGERNDCTVKALAILTGRPYAEVNAALLAAGRKPKRGATVPVMQAAALSLGFNMVAQPSMWESNLVCTYPGAHKGLRSITTHHPRRFAKAWAGQPPMLLRTAGHALAYKDGVVHDWSINRSLRVIDAYTFEPLDPPVSQDVFVIGDYSEPEPLVQSRCMPEPPEAYVQVIEGPDPLTKLLEINEQTMRARRVVKLKEIK